MLNYVWGLILYIGIVFLLQWQLLLYAIWRRVLNTLRLRQYCRHFADDRFKCIFLNDNFSILIRIWLNSVSKSPIDDKQALVHVMARRQTITWTDVYSVHWRIGGDGLKCRFRRFGYELFWDRFGVGSFWPVTWYPLDINRNEVRCFII